MNVPDDDAAHVRAYERWVLARMSEALEKLTQTLDSALTRAVADLCKGTA